MFTGARQCIQMQRSICTWLRVHAHVREHVARCGARMKYSRTFTWLLSIRAEYILRVYDSFKIRCDNNPLIIKYYRFARAGTLIIKNIWNVWCAKLILNLPLLASVYFSRQRKKKGNNYYQFYRNERINTWRGTGMIQCVRIDEATARFIIGIRT